MVTYHNYNCLSSPHHPPNSSPYLSETEAFDPRSQTNSLKTGLPHHHKPGKDPDTQRLNKHPEPQKTDQLTENQAEASYPKRPDQRPCIYIAKTSAPNFGNNPLQDQSSSRISSPAPNMGRDPLLNHRPQDTEGQKGNRN